MLEQILKASIKNRYVVILCILFIAVAGVLSFQVLPIDAVPDITNVQVQINTEAQGYSPYEVEQRITFPIEKAISGIPHLEYTRSISRYGLSQVTVIFEDGTDIFFARQLLNERLQAVIPQLPSGVQTTMGPIATGLGEIYFWTLTAQDGAKKGDGSPYSLADIRTIQDWVITPQLRNIKGIAEINTIGGYEKQYHITPYPEKLISYNISFKDILESLEKNNGNIGAGYIEDMGQQYLIRVPGQLNTIREIEDIPIGMRDGLPIRVRDVASVGEGKELRTGAATMNGVEVVLGTVFMRMGENSRTVSELVDEKIQEIKRSLPKGIVLTTVYNRTNLVNATLATIERNLLEGALLVIIILFLFLGNVRAALLTALVIPLSMLMTVIGMVESHISGNLLSLGALDFGIIVDGAVIIVENCTRRISERQHEIGRILTRQERLPIVFEASREVRKATMFGEAIIMIVYIPILTLTGVEGKMFFPMAITVIMALGAAMILSVTFVPAAVAIFLKGKISEKEFFLLRWSKKLYIPTLDIVLRHKALSLSLAIAFMIISGLLIRSLGSEFLPTLDEGDFAVHGLRITGTSLSQAIEMQHATEQAMKTVPEVQRVFTKIGTAEIATDPMPPNTADIYVMMKPRDQWSDPSKPTSEIITDLEKALKDVPGTKYQFLQPIQMRFNELIAGVRSDVGVKVFGDDMNVLRESAERIAETIKDIPGAADVEIEQVSGLPMITVALKKEMLSRFGLNISDVQDIIAIAIGGKEAGLLYEGDRRFQIIIRLPEEIRKNIDALKDLPIILRTGQTIPLGVIADISTSMGPNQVSRENGKRLIVVTANIRGRDIGSFVDDAKKAIARTVTIPVGYWITWGGQFEHLISASKRLEIIVPIVLLLVFSLLYLSFRSIKDALLIYTGIPFAVTGGIVALWIRDLPFSISAAVGFIALSGMAVLNGLVMITFIRHKISQGLTVEAAVREGAITRLRPVLMTALVASFGFVPMAFAASIGSEVQRPLATVVIGGIVSSTLLTLVILPVLYVVTHKKKIYENAPS